MKGIKIIIKKTSFTQETPRTLQKAEHTKNHHLKKKQVLHQKHRGITQVPREKKST